MIWGITIHHTEGALGDSLERIREISVKDRGFAGIPYHYLIFPDGKVEKVGPEETPRWHCSKRNTGNIGICFVGDYRWGVSPSWAAMGACKKLIADLLVKYPRAVVLGHKHMMALPLNGADPDPDHTSCPGTIDIRMLVPEVK